ncbi:hypothetical protein [Pseudomonas xantholysinigenes]|uniref:Uncharacterized protein n=1 Tax=Pseudomonas xantholysinigenes TaxID=2745490 RepID=A0A9E6PWN1_9PSED|nr:hypothetical protein [Pseudomonas xantholysinigenes]QXI38187.1 hypothetical protein HU772_023150 [Pseudomonas xantholysinigenes]
MTTPSNTAVLTIRQAVARYFMSRPTLRQALESEAYLRLLKQYPSLTVHQPSLHSAAQVYVMYPADENNFRAIKPLMEIILEAVRSGESILFTAEHTFKSQKDGTLVVDEIDAEGKVTGIFKIEADTLNSTLNDLVSNALEYLKRAQIAYWNAADEGDSRLGATSRQQWLCETLRIGLAASLDSDTVDDNQRGCLQALLVGDTQGFGLYAVEAVMQRGEASFRELQPHLLISTRDETANVWLWCPPAGLADGFDDEESFAHAFERMMRQRYDFDALRWNRYELEGDMFMQQAGLILEFLLGKIDSLSVQAFDSVALLESCLHGLTDPASLLLDLDIVTGDPMRMALPGWLAELPDNRRFRVGRVLLDIALRQAESSGRSSLDGIQSPRAYAVQRLEEQMTKSYPAYLVYHPDDLLITLEPEDDDDSPDPVSLTEWALYQHLALNGRTPLSVQHRDASIQLLSWVSVAALRQLVETVDVGGYYPGYVSAQLADPAALSARIRRFAKEWRTQLLLVGLKMWSDGQLSESRWQALAEFCYSTADMKSNVDIAPLAFSVQNLRTRDEVTYMFVIRFRVPAFVLLFSPLYDDDSLVVENDLEKLLNTIKQSPTLVARILDWMSDGAKATYDNNGFQTPHITQGVGVSPAEQDEVEVPPPARISFLPWLADVDTRMFQSMRAMVVKVADNATVSNSEARWSFISGYFIRFFRLLSLLPGPIGNAMKALFALKDIETVLVDHAHAGEHSLASTWSGIFTDLAWGFLFRHTRVQLDLVETPAWVDVDGVLIEPEQRFGLARAVSKGVDYLPGELLRRPGQQVDIASGWGAGPMARQRALASYTAGVDLSTEHRDVASGLYRIGQDTLVELDTLSYRVTNRDHELRVLAGDGRLGPALWRGTEWHVKPGLLGGMGGRAPGRGLGASRGKLQVAVNKSRDTVRAAKYAFMEILKRIAAIDADIARERSVQEVTRLNADGQLTEDMITARISASQAKLVELQAQRDKMSLEGVQARERSLHATRQLDDEIGRLLKYTPVADRSGLLTEQVRWRASCLSDGLYIRDMLLRLCDWQGLGVTAGTLNGRLLTEITTGLKDYRRRLTGAVPLIARMLAAMDSIDELAALLPVTEQFPHGNQLKTVEQFIDAHYFNVIDTRIEYVWQLTELSLAPPKTKQQARWHKVTGKLAGESLRTAAHAHGDLLSSNLAPADRIEILQNAWYAYSNALYQASKQVRGGGGGVDAAMLQKYMEQLELLKQSARSLLVEAVFELEDDTKGQSRRLVYAVKEGVQKAVRTARGDLVVATERLLADGTSVLEVMSVDGGEVVHTFHREGDAWVETLPQAPVPDSESEPKPLPEPAPSQAVAKAQRVLEDGEGVREDVQELIASDGDHRDLSERVDRHIQALKDAQEPLQDTDDLLPRLRDAVQEWTKSKDAWLTELFSKTQKPSAQALSYLHRQGLLEITYERREVAKDRSAFDEYKISLSQSRKGRRGQALWAAHFHLASHDALAADFVVGHLKLWSERKFGRESEQALREQGRILHRGRISLEQAQGIIPFNP